MQNKARLFTVIGLILLLAIILISIYSGAYQFKNPVLQTFIQGISGQTLASTTDHFVFFKVRLPRIVMAILIGSALGVSGTSLQGMFKNPLATPSLIGVTAGASLFAAAAIVLDGFFRQFIPEVLHYSIISLMAFLGAMLTMVFVYRISTSHKKTNVVIMLLAGVAISALAGATTGFLTYLTKEEQLRDLTFWTLGSLGGATWLKNGILAFVIGLSFFFLLNKGKALNAMMLGEQDAMHLGFPIEKIKKQIILLTALMVGTCVAFSGSIGFVGLIVPYILRLIFKSNYHLILPLSALGGALLLLTADTISRTIVSPSEMPIGVLTAFLGAPVFISILIRYKNSF